METRKIQRIALENLLIDLQNPRYDPRINQREALLTIIQEQGPKLLNLAEDIVDKGLNPSELPIVTPTDDGDTFIVLEGNRRIAVLKIILLPSLLNSLGLSKYLQTRFKALYTQASQTFPLEYDCAVMPREEANHWILLKHTGENEGLGVVTWDGRARHRFRQSSPALQAIEMVVAGNYLDEETKKKLHKIAITNIERVLNTPDARKILGVDIKENELILNSPEEALGRLAMIVDDVANKRVNVSTLEFKDDRVNYAQKIASQPLPKPIDPNANGVKGGAGGTPSGGSGNSKTPAKPKVIDPNRKYLIPKLCKLHIPQTRINRIYHELQKLKLEEFINSCAVLFRVFVEMSLDDFGQRKGISLRVSLKPKPGSPPADREMFLREKISAVADYLDTNKICTKDQLKGARTFAQKGDHILSFDSFNAYVHNKDYNPGPSDLRSNWDSIEVFIKAIWT